MGDLLSETDPILLPHLHSIQDKLRLEQVINSPTRSTINTSTLIDHIYLSEHFKVQYFEALTDKLKSPRDFWFSYYKLSPKNNRIPVDLHHELVTAASSLEKANLLNCFFSSCFTNRSDLDDSFCGSSDHSLSSISCTEEEVFNILSTYKTNTACGADGVSSLILRGTTESITPIVTTFF